ncbi:MAG: hypothetical protein IPN43_07815 [Chitinophagaceae bacterium]|nr:hypothetical protein [Chitinophagaceae bacterium]
MNKILNCILSADKVIKERLNNAGATVGGVLITMESIFIFWAGDIKITLITESDCFTSKEHTLLNVLKDAQITIKAEEINRLTHTVVRSVGGDSNAYIPEIVKFERNGPFKGLIYSDGMLSFYS